MAEVLQFLPIKMRESVGIPELGDTWSGMTFYKSFYDLAPVPMGVGK